MKKLLGGSFNQQDQSPLSNFAQNQFLQRFDPSPTAAFLRPQKQFGILENTPKVVELLSTPTNLHTTRMAAVKQGETASNESNKFILVRVNCLKELINNQNQLIKIIKSHVFPPQTPQAHTFNFTAASSNIVPRCSCPSHCSPSSQAPLTNKFCEVRE
mmetsp:Transcript_6971/g.11721  ORF Transcript_6971/g.11721 Transcript_6971/m.11721 type:complete len:158 (+) Transcript_6971:145-618(+)